jgi:hypothetical protein
VNTVKYDPAQFAIQRLSGAAWITVPAASVTWSSDYSLNDNSQADPPSMVSTLIVGSEVATIGYTRWDSEGDVLFPADTVRAVYAGKTFFSGTVDTVTIARTRDPGAAYYGAKVRVDVSCSVAGLYAAHLTRIVSWTSLPAEPWIDRIRRYVTVDRWPDG